MKENEIYDISVKLSDSACFQFLKVTCGHDLDLLNRILKRLEIAKSAEVSESGVDPGDQAGSIDATSAHSSESPPTIPSDGLRIENRDSSDFEISQTAEIDGSMFEPLQPGVTIGHYQLVELLGRGGMGEVWLADQSQPVRRRVAVKLIRAGIGSREILSRFEAERQALALMNHPNIARILDVDSVPFPSRDQSLTGNSSESRPTSIPSSYWGQPFFVMELVNGIPLTIYCDQNRLSIPERLKLFIEICSGVQHAHQKGIIHRDLKPGNILVENLDGKPVPKIIDFGLAKAIDKAPHLTDISLMTGIGQILGTLKYMSPEQAGLNTQDIDTRTDIYALGVILYELLTGSNPLDESSIRGQAALVILEFIRDKEPVKPSSRLESSVETMQSSVTELRKTDLFQLNRILKGDLDWIVMKALEKDRTRRYESASGFAADIERFLRSEPVEARPPSIRYKASKFVRKNKVLVTAASLVFLSLVTGIIGTAWGLKEAVAANKEANESRDKEIAQRKIADDKRAEAEESARRERAAKEQADIRLKQIEAINNSVFDIFTDFDVKTVRAKTSDPFEVVLTRRLAEMGERLNEEVVIDPLSRANLWERLGETILNLGQPKEANRFLQRARDLREKELGKNHPDTLKSMKNLAAGLRAEEKHDAALALSQQVVELRTEILGAEHPDTLESMNSLAIGLGRAGRVKEAVAQLEKILELRTKVLGPDHEQTLDTMSDLGTGYLSAHRLSKAKTMLTKCHEMQSEKLGEDHPDTLKSLESLANCKHLSGEFDEAIELIEKLIRLKKAKLGSDHPDTLDSETNLAFVFVASGEIEKGLKFSKDVLDRQTKVLGEDHPSTLKSMANLAGAYYTDGQFKNAQPLFEKCLAEYKRTMPANHPEISRTMHSLGAVYQKTGQLDLALPLLEESLAHQRANLGDDHPLVVMTLNGLINGYRENQQPEKSIPLLEESLKLTRKNFGANHPLLITTLAGLARGYVETNRLEEARPLYEESLAILEKARFNNPSASKIITMACDGLEKGQFHELAEIWRRKWLEHINKTRESEPLAYSGELALLGLNLMRQQKWEEARKELQECLEIRNESAPELWSTFNTRSMLGATIFKLGRLDEAEPLLLEGFEGMKARLESIPETGRERYMEAIDRLIEFYEARQKPELVEKWKAEKEKKD